MQDLAIIWDWCAFAVRWLHVITAMAWIGSSFYFIALDLGLRKAPDMPDGVHGDAWQVHGGGFYHIRKYLVAPDQMPKHLTWFKWESYSTWLSGAALLMIVYWAGAEIYLIDRAKADLSVFQAVVISGASLGVGWVIYDALCKSPLGGYPTALMVLLFGLLVAMAYGYNQVFTGRATLLHLGAFTATIMSANVFFIIMPNQRIVVKDLQAGRTPDAKYGKIAKLRSTHNNYLTLPVIFVMIGGHYPAIFATSYAWVILALVIVIGAVIRHFFNTKHKGDPAPWWTWIFAGALTLFAVFLSHAGAPKYDEQAYSEYEFGTGAALHVAAVELVTERCASCHAVEPLWDGIAFAPKGVRLENEADILRRVDEIYWQAAASHAMPPGNVIWMEPEEREMLARWRTMLKAGGAAPVPTVGTNDDSG